MTIFKKIIVPVDGSPYALDALRLAVKIATIHGSELRLLHVLDTLIMQQLKRFSNLDLENIRKDLKHQALGFLKDMEREARKENIKLEVRIEEGIPHEAILKEVITWGADLVVMGKLGRRGISHIVLGSVTERVIEFSEVPVLVVK